MRYEKRKTLLSVYTLTHRQRFESSVLHYFNCSTVIVSCVITHHSESESEKDVRDQMCNFRNFE